MLAAFIHIFEEFVFPGGFKRWWCAYRPEIAESVTNRFLIIINVVLVLFSANVALASQAPRGSGVAAWLALAALLAFNAVFHGRLHPDEALLARYDFRNLALYPACHLRLRILPWQRKSIGPHSDYRSGDRKLILFYFHVQSPSQGKCAKKDLTRRCDKPRATPTVHCAET